MFSHIFISFYITLQRVVRPVIFLYIVLYLCGCDHLVLSSDLLKSWGGVWWSQRGVYLGRVGRGATIEISVYVRHVASRR